MVWGWECSTPETHYVLPPATGAAAAHFVGVVFFDEAAVTVSGCVGGGCACENSHSVLATLSAMDSLRR
jgi:hypothetical protein